MRGKRTGAGAAMVVGALAAASLAFAPGALAVTPQTATISADCGAFGSGEATLTATQDGTAATITVTSAVTAPIALSQDSISSTLTLVNNTNGSTSTFSGTKNPAIAAGDPVTVGPLDGTVASGDSLEAYGGSLQLVVFGITVTCTATGPQSPGPFVFD
ncbi:hypothetical protein [Streptomyces griseorubiginosus]|uniref:hypothetical protein n=1 Tax=Streptomyces griseorubiginosus TaxID=67304 RepID=UPI001AD75C62|nr:hypothetical protein [Streptomyces griseorubiginosus]MBO4255249.1 hypothetical protein [Streptomyces griseorubiginosus]